MNRLHLSAAPEHTRLTEAQIEQFAAQCRHHSATSVLANTPDTLLSQLKAQGQLRFDDIDWSPLAEQHWQSWCQQVHWDMAYFAQTPRWSDYKLVVFDMDSTLIQIECIDELADFAGKKTEVAALTEAAMQGHVINYADSLRQRVALLQGLPVGVLHQVVEQRLKLTDGAEILVNAAHQAGLQVVIASGGFTFFTEALKRKLPITAVFANVLEIKHHYLTGRVQGLIVDGEAKAQALRQCCAQWGYLPSAAIAIGDGANDLPMMAQAGLSIAFHAKPAVKQQARQHVEVGGLEVIARWLS